MLDVDHGETHAKLYMEIMVIMVDFLQDGSGRHRM